MTAVPAFVRNGRLDILGANPLGRALYSQHFDSHAQPPNTARFVFLDDRSTRFYLDWNRVADGVVAILRAEAGRDPYDRELSDLVGQLSTRSELFRTLWAAHNVRTHDTGSKMVRRGRRFESVRGLRVSACLGGVSVVLIQARPLQL